MTYSPNVGGVGWIKKIPSFGCIMVLETGIDFLPLPHDKLVKKTLLFTMVIPLKVCTQIL